MISRRDRCSEENRRMIFQTNEGGYVTITNSPPNLSIPKQDSWSFFLHPMSGVLLHALLGDNTMADETQSSHPF